MKPPLNSTFEIYFERSVPEDQGMLLAKWMWGEVMVKEHIEWKN